MSPINNASDYSVLTPYLIPPALRDKKVVNLGDGFILRAIERRVGHFASECTVSPRVKPGAAEKVTLARGKGVILAGATQLNDRYSIWPGLKADDVRASSMRFIPFGIGLHGEVGYTVGLTAESLEILRIIHERIEYSSWRCPRTVRFLEAQLPELKGRMLMTGCPVTYDNPLLNGTHFLAAEKRVAVTVTERNNFWERETRTIDFVSRRFPHAERFLVLHQNFSPAGRFEPLKHRLLPYTEVANPYERLRWYAAKRGLRIVSPPTADACLAFYRTIDLHIGSRLHAHLHFISQNKRTFLVAVDGRAIGMAEYLGFPLCDPIHFETYLNFDFEIVRARAQAGFEDMKRFLRTL